jgi:hypothetical protein
MMQNVHLKSRTAMAKKAFNKRKAYFTSEVDLNLRKKQVKCNIWSTAFYGSEIRSEIPGTL